MLALEYCKNDVVHLYVEGPLEARGKEASKWSNEGGKDGEREGM